MTIASFGTPPQQPDDAQQLVVSPQQTVIPSVKPVVPQVQPVVPPVQPGPVPPLNWSHFKPGFAGEPWENLDACLLRTNDWVGTHAFHSEMVSKCKGSI